MRIISKFKDYYDYMSYLGIDPACVYVRHIECMVHPSKRISYEEMYNSGGKFISLNSSKGRWERYPKLNREYIAFCGIQYTFYTWWTPEKTEYIAGKSVITQKESFEIIWNMERVIEIYKEHSEYLRWSSTIRDMKYTVQNQIVKIDDKIFKKFNIPCYTSYGADNGEIIINPNLGELKFPSIVSAQKAWQEISMYVSGILSNSNDGMIKLQNDDRIKKGGFDLKTSFRRDKHPRKSKKNK